MIMSVRRSLAAAAVGSAAFFSIIVDKVSAQVSTEANCVGGVVGPYGTLFNSLGQSPCYVGAALSSSCDNGKYDVPALQPGTVYTGPNSEDADECQCSTVIYSLLSACAACQNETFIDWPTWSGACSVVYLSFFPETVPTGVAISGWAYQDVATLGTFNLQEALTDQVSGSAIVQPSTSTVVRITSVPTAAAPSHKKSDAGAIAGGVVGGVAAVVLLAILGPCLLRARNRRRNNMNNFSRARRYFNLEDPGQQGIHLDNTKFSEKADALRMSRLSQSSFNPFSDVKSQIPDTFISAPPLSHNKEHDIVRSPIQSPTFDTKQPEA